MSGGDRKRFHSLQQVIGEQAIRGPGFVTLAVFAGLDQSGPQARLQRAVNISLYIVANHQHLIRGQAE